MLPTSVIRTIYTLTIAAWVVVVLNASPLGDHITQEQTQLAILVACIGSLKWLVRRMLWPAHELFQAGKVAGRAEGRADALAELDDPVVVNLADRRALRAVSKL